jgi:hypothetical protein
LAQRHRRLADGKFLFLSASEKSRQHLSRLTRHSEHLTQLPAAVKASCAAIGGAVYRLRGGELAFAAISPAFKDAEEVREASANPSLCQLESPLLGERI